MIKEDRQIFKHKEFGELTVLTKDGEFFFVGKEVAEKLGYSNPHKALRDHVEEEEKRTERIIHPFGGVQNTILINESGLYSLILSSKLESAKRFKRWVTSEVLPSIRKHGGYIFGQEKQTREEILANALLVAQRVIQEKEEQLHLLSPKGKYYDELVEAGAYTNLRNTAKEFQIPQNTFIQFLMKEGLIYRDKKGRLLPYSIPMKKGLFVVKEFTQYDGSFTGVQTHVTAKGRHYILLLLERRNRWDE